MTHLSTSQLGPLLALLGLFPLTATAQTPPSNPYADYMSEVQMLLQRDFMVPGSIPQSERVGLRVGVTAIIGPDRHFRSIEITEPSGHEAFDRAVATHVAALLASRPRLPVVPREFRTRIVGVPITVSFEPPPPRVPASTAPAAEH